MDKKDMIRADKVIEPEILDENGRPINDEIRSQRSRRTEGRTQSARPKGDLGGLVGGFFVLAFGFIMTFLVAVFALCIFLPLMLLGKLLGFQTRTFRR